MRVRTLSNIWSLYADEIRTLSGRLGFRKDSLEFLAYSMELEFGRIFDKLKGEYVENQRMLYIMLSHYAKSDPVQKVGKLIRFRDLPGGYAYEGAFTKRAVDPIARIFGSEPNKLVEAARVLDGIEAKYGDSSVEIPALPTVPMTYVLWKSNEFPASSTVLLDASASHYLPTEDIAVLGEITTMRLARALDGDVEQWSLYSYDL
jgi:hypothetical protein